MSDWVGEWARQCGLADNIARKLDLCSTEVVTNIISYAYDDHAEHMIALRLRQQNNLLTLEVEDDGKPFDPLQVRAETPVTSLEDPRIGGCGIPLVRRFSDAAAYRHVDGRNCLVLTFCCGADTPP